MKKNQLISLIFLIIGTMIALVPNYFIRYQQHIYMWFYDNLTTYPGDLWNFFTNYLSKGALYPPEYPTGLRFFYEVMGFYKYQDYTWFFTVNCIILAFFAAGITYLLWKIICHSELVSESNEITKRVRDDKLKTNSEKQTANIWYFWILAPSFIFYSTLNYDLPVVFLIVLAVYLFMKEKYYGATAALAIGTVVKVFPVFLLPIFILKSPKKDWLNLFLLFGAIVLLLNLPYMFRDFDSFMFTYTWQIGQNLSKDPSAGTYWWIFYPIFGKFTGWVSLLLFAGLYYFSWKKLKNTSIIQLGIAVILIFLLTDRIYSPQYNLYLLPFLALATYKVNKPVFYIMDFFDVAIVLFCFFLKDNPVYLQIIVFARYGLLIWLYRDNLKVEKQELISN